MLWHTCVLLLAADRPLDAGNGNVLVCERGSMFGYSDLVVDPRNLVLMRDAGCPVTVDITHALQQPTGRALEVCSCSLRSRTNLSQHALSTCCWRVGQWPAGASGSSYLLSLVHASLSAWMASSWR